MLKGFFDWLGDFVRGVMDGFQRAERKEFVRPCGSRGPRGQYPCAMYECLPEDLKQPQGKGESE